MPTAYCPDGHKTYWHARRGTSLANVTCDHCGKGDLRKSVNLTCVNGDKFYTVNPRLTTCQDGHAWQSAAEKPRPAIWWRGAQQRAKRLWGPTAFAEQTGNGNTIYVIPPERIPEGALHLWTVGRLCIVGVRANGDTGSWPDMSRATIHGWGATYREAFDNAEPHEHLE